jgi:valyl-tRNA synthetase
MPTVAEDAPLEARWIVAELHATAEKVNQSLEAYRLRRRGQRDLSVLLGQLLRLVPRNRQAAAGFLDGDGGQSKPDKQRAALTTLVSVFEASLRLLSPFMPFLTEEVVARAL